MNNQDNTTSHYKTPEKRLISCRKANKKYYEKNKDEIKKKVLERYYQKKGIQTTINNQDFY